MRGTPGKVDGSLRDDGTVKVTIRDGPLLGRLTRDPN
jgi:hypothetical protein